jgi:ferrous iron transport protein A
MILIGLVPGVLEKSTQTPSLSRLADLPDGSRAQIYEIHGGRALARRLLSLGLRVGSEVNVVQRRGHGMVVASTGSRIALGAGVADKLMVIPVA